jgi:hypothetical protein
MRLAKVPKSTDCESIGAAGGGDVQRRPYGEMYAGSYVLDGERVDIRGTPPAEYSDPIVVDELTQEWGGVLYRLWPKEKYLAKGGPGERRLHRKVWAAAFGPIPAECHIHHRDGDPLNNAFANLECMPANEHLSVEWYKLHPKGHRHFSENAKRGAAEWHASPEGSVWHSIHATESRSWLKWKREPAKCLHCGAEFAALIRKGVVVQVYCRRECKVAAYRATGIQNKYSADYREREKVKRDGGRLGPNGSGD